MMMYIKKTATTLLGSLAATAIFAFVVSMACQSNDAEKADGPAAGGDASFQLENAFPALNFDRPVEFTHAGDGTNRVFVLEQPGRIRLFENDPAVKTAGVYLDIQSRVSSAGEMGLLGLAFHPNFKQNGYFFVNYTKDNPRETIISRFKASTANANQVDPTTETILLRFPQPYANHNGGKIAFGPDGFLYIATGDGGSGGDPQNNAQNRTNYLGKILRIDVNATTKGAYGIPADNPYVGNKDGHLEEIFAYGLRNPWRFSFDSNTGQIWAGDVGQNTLEEIDIITKGGNYGWRLKEGNNCFNPANNCDQGNLVMPVHQYPRTDGLSITGGVVYRGTKIPALQGKYIYADYVSKKVWSLNVSGSTASNNQLIASDAGSVSAFGEDANKELYILDHTGGSIKRFVAKP
ncbi:PQQ-dependent sugar dehydrogenase [Tellurirhabdus bombi]|uniref:PQQ-dependent sugar dehydrogenase n=1 Tax=Tellurirhabdus bombi TaxID=2907205 RepID=UPI00387F4D0A